MKYDFVAVDFENADSDQFACSVGIVAVKNSQIVDEVYYLIQPPGNRYGKIQIGIHGIYPKDTKDSPTFDKVWPEIEKYFSGQNLIMHSSGTDKSILHKSLSYYFIEIPEYTYNDTCNELECGRTKLEILAKSFNVELINHHNSLEDARATANIWLMHLRGIRPDFRIIEIEKNKKKKGLYDDKKMDPDLYKKDLSKADKSSPFYDRKVVITGDFSERKEMGRKLKLMGADIDHNITRKTHFVIIGNNPTQRKMDALAKLKFDGYSISTLSEDDLNRIFADNLNDDDFVNKETIKDLKITINHILGTENSFKIDLNRINMFSGKEIYVSQSIKSRSIVNHLIGFLGAFTNSILEKDIDIVLLSDRSMVNIKNEIPDDDVELIERIYNGNKSINFKFCFLMENDFIRYYKHRMKTSHCDDESVMTIFNKYINSINNLNNDEI